MGSEFYGSDEEIMFDAESVDLPDLIEPEEELGFFIKVALGAYHRVYLAQDNEHW